MYIVHEWLQCQANVCQEESPHNMLLTPSDCQDTCKWNSGEAECGQSHSNAHPPHIPIPFHGHSETPPQVVQKCQKAQLQACQLPPRILLGSHLGHFFTFTFLYLLLVALVPQSWMFKLSLVTVRLFVLSCSFPCGALWGSWSCAKSLVAMSSASFCTFSFACSFAFSFCLFV